MKRKITAGHLIQHFFQGILILAPIFFTGYAIYWIFQELDSFIQIDIPHVGIIPGLGVLLIIIGITVVGYLSSSFILGRLFDFFDRLMEKTPLIRYLYGSIKDVFDAFIGEKRKFDRPVLVSIYSPDVWELGFITQEDTSRFGLLDSIAVYVPMSYAISGKVYFVKRTLVKPVHELSAGEAMKFLLSGGVTGLDGHSADLHAGPKQV